MFLYRRLVKAGALLVAISAAGCAGWAASCAGPQALEAAVRSHPGEQTYMELGKWFDQNLQCSCATESYRAALKFAPRSPAVLDMLAKSLIACRDYPAAIDLLRAAPREDELTIDLATSYDKADMQDKAFQTLSGTVRQSPSSAPLTNALVIFLANHEQLEDAYRLAQSFYERHPHEMDAGKLYLRVLVATNNSATGEPLARKLLANAPHDGELLYLNGVLERKAGEFTLARGHLQQSIALNPDFGESRYNLGIVLAKLQDVAGAKEQLEKAIALGAAEPEARLELSKAQRALGDTQQAKEQLALYQQAMKASADRAMADNKSALAAQELKNGDPKKAAALYREALDATPQDASLEYKLALALDRAGDTAAERAALEHAVQLDQTLTAAQDQLGYLLYRSGDYESAERHFRLAVTGDPDFAHAWISLAATLATQSRFSDAQEALNHALRLEPHNAEALEMMKELTASHPPH
jgi:Flp pilus assembly protein TadD